MKMRYLKQENSHYNAQINRYGCYFLSLLRMVEELKKLDFDHKEVLQYYDLFVNNKSMLSNCDVVNPDKLLGYFDLKVTTRKGAESSQLSLRDLGFYVAKIEMGTTGHFILCEATTRSSLTIKDKYWDSLFLNKNDQPLTKDAFRIFERR